LFFFGNLDSGATSLHRRKKGAERVKELRDKEVCDHAKDLIDTTSFHGICYIFDKRHPVRRVIWFLITVSAFIYSMLKVYESTVNHFSYPFILNGTKVDNAILTNNPGNVSADVYRNVTRSAAHEIHEMLVDCEFDGRKCSSDNFTEFHWKQGDRCFTFNSGKPGHPLLKVTGPGTKKSLSLTINLQHYDYYRGGLVSGIHLILHGQDETPVRMRGAMLSPGFTTFIQVEKKKVSLS